MSKKEFDNLTGELKPDYPKKEIPKHLDEVGKEKNQSVKLNLSDYWNILKAVFRNEALLQLEGKPSAIIAAYSMRYSLILLAGIILLSGITSLIKGWL